MDALAKLENMGYSFSVIGDSIAYVWRKEGRPPQTAAALLRELRQQKAAALALLRQRKAAPEETATVAAAPGVVLRLYRMRPTCEAARHCLARTVELDCNLFPVRAGWCRERVQTRRKEAAHETH